MNFQETLHDMLTAAAAAAKIHWRSLRSFAEQEFRALGESAAFLEADLLADLASAHAQPDAPRRAEMEQKAHLRATLAFENLKLATHGLVLTAQADAKLAAQDAINAALGVLAAALNKSIGFALF